MSTPFRALRSLACSIALPALSVSVHGQLFPGQSQAQQQSGKHYWGPLADAQFGAVVSGDFTGEGHLDAVVLDDGVPLLLLEPHLFVTSLHAPFACSDIALLRAQGAGAEDALLAVGSAGLVELRFDVATGAWDSRVLAPTAFGATARVQVGDLDGDGGQDIVSSGGPDPRTVYVGYDDGAGNYPTTAQFQSAQAIQALHVLDWDGDGQREIALLTDFGVEVYDAAFLPVWWYAWSWTELQACTLSAQAPGSAGREALSVVATDLAGNQWLVLVGENLFAGPWALGPLGVVALAAGDLDGDLDSDLVLGTNTQTAIRALENLSAAGGYFDPVNAVEDVEVGDPTRDPALNGAGLCAGDFDGDGDLDVLVPVQGDATSETQIGNEIPSAIQVVNGEDVDQNPWQPRISAVEFDYAPGVSFDVEISLAAPAALLPAGAGDTRELEIRVWHDAALGVPADPVGQLLSLPIPATTGTFTIVTGSPDHEFDDVFGFVLRQVVHDSSGNLVAEGPAYGAVYAGSEGYSELQTLFGVVEAQVAEDASVLPGGIGDSVNGGGIVIGPELPPFDDDETPAPL